MVARLFVVFALANTAFSYSNTVPVVAWSSSSSSSLDSLPSRLNDGLHSASLLDKIFSEDDVCDHDAVVIVEQPGVHATDLGSLSPDSHISRGLYLSPSSRQYPYVSTYPELDIVAFASNLSAKCGSYLLQYAPGDNGVTLESDRKHVVCMRMAQLHQSGKERKETMAKHETILGNELSTLGHAFPNHLVVFIGTPLPSSLLHKRQNDAPDRPILDLSPLAANTTLPEGGILKRYQLLTPGLISVLLIVLFVLLPVTMAGMNALASIQNPLRVDTSKSFNAQERKNQ